MPMHQKPTEKLFGALESPLLVQQKHSVFHLRAQRNAFRRPGVQIPSAPLGNTDRARIVLIAEMTGSSGHHVVYDSCTLYGARRFVIESQHVLSHRNALELRRAGYS
jgi:hypothetical protein